MWLKPSGVKVGVNRDQEADDEPEYSFPNLTADPADYYRDRFGVEGEHDRFLFPWLSNLIFEDRWLLAEPDPAEALKDQISRRMKADIREPGPDTATFPNSAFTLPKGRLYIENSPLGLYDAKLNRLRGSAYQWNYLIRYGLTDNLEFRVFSNGLTYQATNLKRPAQTGISPLVFDFKANFWEENRRYHIPAFGVEVYLQTTFGSPAFDRGTQPSISLLFDETLPFDIVFESNVGVVGLQNATGRILEEVGVQWSFERKITRGLDVFCHGFYNEAALPRLAALQDVLNPRIPNVTVVGVGAVQTVTERLAVFGSYNFGVTPASPRTIAFLGFAMAF